MCIRDRVNEVQSNDAFLQVLLFPYGSKSWNWVRYIKILIINKRFYLLTEIFRQPTKIKKFNRLPTKIENFNRLPTKYLNFNRQPPNGPPFRPSLQVGKDNLVWFYIFMRELIRNPSFPIPREVIVNKTSLQSRS